jgi:hypothetical protein
VLEKKADSSRDKSLFGMTRVHDFVWTDKIFVDFGGAALPSAAL